MSHPDWAKGSIFSPPIFKDFSPHRIQMWKIIFFLISIWLVKTNEQMSFCFRCSFLIWNWGQDSFLKNYFSKARGEWGSWKFIFDRQVMLMKKNSWKVHQSPLNLIQSEMTENWNKVIFLTFCFWKKENRKKRSVKRIQGSQSQSPSSSFTIESDSTKTFFNKF